MSQGFNSGKPSRSQNCRCFLFSKARCCCWGTALWETEFFCRSCFSFVPLQVSNAASKTWNSQVLFEKSNEIGGVWRSNYAGYGAQVKREQYLGSAFDVWKHVFLFLEKDIIKFQWTRGKRPMISSSQSRGIPLSSWTPRIWISTQQVGSCHLGETSEVVYVFVDDLHPCSKRAAKLGQSFWAMEFLGNRHRPIIVNHGYRCLFRHPGQQRPKLIQYRRIALDYMHLRYYLWILDIRWKSWCIWEHRWKTQLVPAAQEASLWRLCSHLFASTISSPGCAGSET